MSVKILAFKFYISVKIFMKLYKEAQQEMLLIPRSRRLSNLTFSIYRLAVKFIIFYLYNWIFYLPPITYWIHVFKPIDLVKCLKVSIEIEGKRAVHFEKGQTMPVQFY